MLLVTLTSENEHNDGEVENSPRRRILEDWDVDSYPANDPTITIYRLRGWVTQEADGFEPPARVTRTSPIAACKGNVVTTASGSKYVLGNPRDGYKIHSPEQYIPDTQLNSWIEGTNWLTI